MSKVLKILSKLDHKTLNRFESFISSEYFNASEVVKTLGQILIKSVKTNKDIDKDLTWSLLYIDEAFNDQRWRKLNNSITSLLESFFSIESTLDDQNLKIRTIAKYSEDQNILELKNKLSKQLSETISDDKIISSQSVYDLYTAKRLLIDLDSDFAKRKGTQSQKKLISDFHQLNGLLDMAYVLEKIRLSMLQGNYSSIFGVNQVANNQDIIYQIIKENKHFDHKLFSNYYQIFSLLTKAEGKYAFNNFNQYLNELAQDNRKEALELYLHLSNYLVRKLNAGEDMNFEWLELMKFGLSSKLILKNEIIEPYDYINIVLAALRQKEYDWALKFVEEYKSFLSSEFRQSAYSFTKARIFMNMGRYEDVVDSLRNVEYEDVIYNINSKLMLMAAFYELDEYDILESTIKAFKIFLRRRRNISKSRKANFNDHCDALYQIIKASERRDTKRLLKAQDIIDNNSGIPNRAWLQERIKEVEEQLGVHQEQNVSS